MESKENNKRQQHLGISSTPATALKQLPQESQDSSVEDEPSELPSSSQPVTAPCSGSLKHGGERDDMAFPCKDETKSPHLTKPEYTLQDWQNEIDDLSAPKIDIPMISYPPKPPEGQHEDPFLESTSKVGIIHGKVAELRNIARCSSKISRVQEYWNALSKEKKRNFLEVSVNDLRAHHASKRGQLAGKLITEAVSYTESNKTWVFRVCFICNQIFKDQETHTKHVWLHIGNFSSELLLHFPEEIDISWAEMLANGIWQPFDFFAVVKILHSQRVSQFPTGVGSSDVGVNVDDSNNDSFSETSVQAMHLDTEAGIEHVGVESGGGSGSSSSNLVDGNETQEEADPVTKGWPLSNDPVRLELLQRIHIQFLLLLRLKCLTKTHMIQIMDTTTRCLKKFATGFEPLAYGFDKTYACICLLDVPRLQNLLHFLAKLNQVADDSENTIDKSYNCSVDAPVSDVQKGISLSDDLSHLILNNFLFTVDTSSTFKSSIHECSNDPVHPKDGVIGREDFIPWIYTSMSTDEELKSWIHARDEKRCQGVDIFVNLRKIFNEIQNLLMEKRKNLHCVKVLADTWSYCHQQHSQRSGETECIPLESLEAILRKRQEALAEGEDNLERDIIALVLKEAQVLDGSQSIQGNIPNSSDSISSLNDESSTQDSLHLSNSSILSGFKRQDMTFLVETSEIEIKIRQKITFMRQLKCKLAAISAFDYLEIIFFLVKTFLREHLESLADKEAEMKSDAAREGLLAELELEEKNNIKKGHCNSKQTKEKLNKRKKKKDQSRAKDNVETLVPTYEENAEQAPLLFATNIEVNKRGEIVVTERDHDLKKLGKAFGCYAVLEADESLDYQWEIVKPKKRADKYEKRSRMYTYNAKVRKEVPTSAVSNTSYQDQGKELQQSKQVSLQHDHSPVSLTSKLGDEMYGDERFQADLEKAIQESIGDQHPGDSNMKVLEKSGDKEDGDERFQANLEKAIQESLADQSPGNSNVKVLEQSGDEELSDQSIGDSNTKIVEQSGDKRFQSDYGKAILKSIGDQTPGNSNTKVHEKSGADEVLADKSPGNSNVKVLEQSGDEKSGDQNLSDSNTKVLEQSSDERFQSDLGKAIQESMGDLTPGNSNTKVHEKLGADEVLANKSPGNSNVKVLEQSGDQTPGNSNVKVLEQSGGEELGDQSLGDSNTKVLEQSGDKRFQADPEKAIQESIGDQTPCNINTKVHEKLGDEELGYQCPGDSNTKVLEQSGYEEYGDERYQVDLEKAIQESIGDQTLGYSNAKVKYQSGDEEFGDRRLGNSNTKVLEQSGDEEYGNERFHADLEKAIQESIESFQEQKDLPIEKISKKISDDCRDSCTKVVASIESRRDAIRKGLKNDADDDCFIDTILQSLWCIRRFREEFLRKSKSLHQHVGDPCIVCALYDIFTALSTQPTETYRKAFSHTDLKTRLSRLCANLESFQEQMNDAAKVLNAIFNCLHQSFTSSPGPSDILLKGGSGPSDTVPRENKMCSWDCSSEDCMAHNLFGMDILEMIACCNCSVESRCQKFTSFVHFINASELQKMQIASSDRSLDELLKHMKINIQYTCNPENGGCGSRNYIHLIRATAPHVFIAVLQQGILESGDDTSTALAAINAELDIGIISRDLSQRKRYCLISVICYNNQLYSCFAYSLELELWVIYGNTTVKVIGGCNDLLAMIRREKLQPLVLFFESVIRYPEK